MNCKCIRRNKVLETVGISANTPQHQRRIQRHGIKAVGGHTDLLAIAAQGGNNSYARGETAQSIAEIGCAEVGIRHYFLVR
jgi:hypothetical protein